MECNKTRTFVSRFFFSGQARLICPYLNLDKGPICTGQDLDWSTFFGNYVAISNTLARIVHRLELDD